jgi:serine/threonine-protein kinase
MLTGLRPFTHDNLDDLLLAHAHEEVPTFADAGFTDPLPPGLETLVRSCLAKHPDQRPRDAMELAQRYELALGRRINVIRRAPTSTAPSNGSRPATPIAPARPAMLPPAGSGVRHSLETMMPEAMAMVKLRGFIYDLGGEVVESVPGMIKVRIPGRQPQTNSGLFGWMSSNTPRATTTAATDIELHMERRDPSQPGKLTITLVIKPTTTAISMEWQTRCKKIGMDLQAYLMGR